MKDPISAKGFKLYWGTTLLGDLISFDPGQDTINTANIGTTDRDAVTKVFGLAVPGTSTATVIYAGDTTLADLNADKRDRTTRQLKAEDVDGAFWTANAKITDAPPPSFSQPDDALIQTIQFERLTGWDLHTGTSYSSSKSASPSNSPSSSISSSVSSSASAS